MKPFAVCSWVKAKMGEMKSPWHPFTDATGGLAAVCMQERGQFMDWARGLRDDNLGNYGRQELTFLNIFWLWRMKRVKHEGQEWLYSRNDTDYSLFQPQGKGCYVGSCCCDTAYHAKSFRLLPYLCWSSFRVCFWIVPKQHYLDFLFLLHFMLL